MKKIHILHLIATEFVGGPEKQVLTHLRFVDRDRFDLSVGSFLEGGRPNAFLQSAADSNLETLAVHQHMPMDPRLIWHLRNELARRRVDGLITHGYKSNVVGYLAAWGRIPHAMYVRGWTSESRRVQWYHWLERRVLPRAKLVVTVAERKRQEIESLGVAPAKIRVIVNAVEATPLKQSITPLRKRYNIGDRHFLILAAGRLSPEKGHRVLIEALATCKNRGLSTACVIFGEGPEEEALRRDVVQAKMQDSVILAGFDADWKAHLAEADALVNPSFSEVMPNVVLESLVHRCPVIATGVGGVPELIPDTSMGLVVPPGDAVELAQAILRLASGEINVDALTARAYQHVIKDFTFEAQANSLHTLYQELVTSTTRV